MKINWLIVATIFGPILGAIAWAYISGFVEKRPRLITWTHIASSVQVQPPGGQPYWLNTHAVVVRNAGKRTATNVRLGHNQFPRSYSVYPAHDHTLNNPPGGGTEIVIPTLVPNDQVTITYLYSPPLTWNQVNTYVRSDEGLAQVIYVLPTQVQPVWLLRVAAAILLLGAGTAIYFLVQFILWLATRGPA